MSQENVEIVRRGYEAWNEGGSELAKEFWAEDMSTTTPRTFPTRAWCGGGMQWLPI